MTDEDKENRESYVRWQEYAIAQLGYTINLFLTLSGATLGFALKILMESQTPLSGSAHYLFLVALLLLGLSIIAALAANWTRLQDFRFTRRAARERVEKGNNHEHYKRKAECYGNWTWGLFYLLTLSFGLGVVLFALSIWFAYSNRI
jgi:hypothetical protein